MAAKDPLHNNHGAQKRTFFGTTHFSEHLPRTDIILPPTSVRDSPAVAQRGNITTISSQAGHNTMCDQLRLPRPEHRCCLRRNGMHLLHLRGGRIEGTKLVRALIRASSRAVADGRSSTVQMGCQARWSWISSPSFQQFPIKQKKDGSSKRSLVHSRWVHLVVTI